jgi:hypothetical protein
MIMLLMLLGLFAMIGVSFFSGLFYTCQTDNIPASLAINNYWDCLDNGGEWLNQRNNFDNVFQALKTQFVIMCLEGWYGVYRSAVNLPSSHYTMPRENQNPWVIAYFVMCLIGSALFMLNLFVVIVLLTFAQEKDKVTHHTHLTAMESEYIDACTMCYRSAPQRIHKP